MKHLKRVLSWVFRFIKNCQSKVGERNLNILSVKELQIAEELLILDNQQSFISCKSFDNTKLILNVKVDKNNIMRCHGRLENAPLPFESKFPILLNSDHKLTELLVKETHYRNLHSGTKQTLTDLRQRFWIVKGRSFVKKVLKYCRICRKSAGPPYPYPDPELSQLPSFRLNDDRPFAAIGVDLCGPLFVKNVFCEVEDELFKVWVVLFTCASSRAILLDIVPNLQASAFIRCFIRFVSRRGCPDLVVSDNGTNFIAEETQSYVSNLNVVWKFNLPRAPWFGGFFERLIRTVKNYLKLELSKSKLTYEQLQTLLLEIEQTVRSHMSNQPI